MGDAPSPTQERKAYARDPAYGKPPNWSRVYDKHFPQNTDGCSRHVKLIAEWLRDPSSPVRRFMIDEGYEPDHWAQSMEITVLALWRTRQERDRLLGPEEVERRFQEALDKARASVSSRNDGSSQQGKAND